jgi:putative ABC transport system permease protein
MAFTQAFRRIVAILRRDHMLRDLEDEMRLHVELRAKRLESHGWSRADALHAARARFGSATRLAEQSRDAWGAHRVDVVMQDLRYAARGLRRTPGFATIVVLTLALGLGVNAAVFSVVSHLFADAPPGILEPHQIRRVYVSQNTHAGAVDVRNRFNYPEVADLRAAIGGSVPMTSYLADSALVGDAETGRFVTVGYTDAEYWRVLGVRPAMGRTYAPTEARIEVPVFTAVISDAFWHRELGGRADVLGHTIEVAGHRMTVIGVAPPGFAGPDLDRTDVWLPLGAMPMAQYGSRAWYQIRGVSRLDVLLRVGSQDAMQRVEAQLTSVYRHGSVAAGYARDPSAHVLTGPIAVALGPMTPRREAVIATRLAWISLIVLLIACANIANIWMTRMIDRRREIAVRLALGISRRRLAGQILTEVALLGALAGGAALFAGLWGSVALQRTLMPEAHWSGAALQWRVVLGTAVAGFASVLMIALAPVLHLQRFAGNEELKSGARTVTNAGRRTRGVLVFSQTALAVMLLAAAGLFVQSLRRVLAVDVGYDVDRVVYARPIPLGERGGEVSSRRLELERALEETARRMEGVRGVESVALTRSAPMTGYYTAGLRMPNGDSLPQLNGEVPAMHDVSPEFWRVAGIAPRRGRVTTNADVAGQQLVVVVNDAMARVVWPGADPIGKCVVVFAPDSPCRTVVGVVPTRHEMNVVEKERMQMYLPIAQASATGTSAGPWMIMVRVVPDRATEVAAVLQRTLSAELPNAELGVREMRSAIEPQFRPWRLGAVLFTLLGGLALAIALIGLYGIVSYGVRRRTHELGVRVALGAQQSAILTMVVGESVKLVAISIAGGLVASFIAARFLASLLYDTSIADPTVMIVVTSLILASAVFASLIPALRASRVPPASALAIE